MEMALSVTPALGEALWCSPTQCGSCLRLATPRAGAPKELRSPVGITSTDPLWPEHSF